MLKRLTDKRNPDETGRAFLATDKFSVRCAHRPHALLRPGRVFAFRRKRAQQRFAEVGQRARSHSDSTDSEP